MTAADRYEADVADDGTWQVVLVLNPGSNVASFTATGPTGLESTAEVVVWYDPPVHYFKYGETGLYRVTGHGEELIHAGPVSSATPTGPTASSSACPGRRDSKAIGGPNGTSRFRLRGGSSTGWSSTDIQP